MEFDAVDGAAGANAVVIAEMITNHSIWRGVGVARDEARQAVLDAWSRHRSDVVPLHSALASSLPLAGEMPRHFRIR